MCFRHKPFRKHCGARADRADLQVAADLAELVVAGAASPSFSPRASASPGCMSRRTSGRGSSESVEVMVRSLAGGISVSGNSGCRRIGLVAMQAGWRFRFERFGVEVRLAVVRQRPDVAELNRAAAKRWSGGADVAQVLANRLRHAGDDIEHLLQLAARLAGLHHVEALEQFAEHVRVRARFRDTLDHRLSRRRLIGP